MTNNNQQCNNVPNATCTDAGARLRTCTCPTGYIGTSTLTGTQVFAGCYKIGRIHLYLTNILDTEACHSITCSDGSYCSIGNGTRCILCNPPCAPDEIEVQACSSLNNRICLKPGLPTCDGGCGIGECVARNVCRCPLIQGVYGMNSLQ